MVRAMKDARLPDLGCFAHTLQLVVHDEVLSQRAVIDILATYLLAILSTLRLHMPDYAKFRKFKLATAST